MFLWSDIDMSWSEKMSSDIHLKQKKLLKTGKGGVVCVTQPRARAEEERCIQIP